MRTAVLPCLLVLVAAVPPALAAEGDFERSIEVEKLGPAAYRVKCKVSYEIADPRQVYAVDLYAGGTGVSPTFPYGAQVGPDQRRMELEAEGWRLTVHLAGRQLSAQRVFTYRFAPGPAIMTYCQGGARNVTTGRIYPGLLMYDYLQN